MPRRIIAYSNVSRIKPDTSYLARDGSPKGATGIIWVRDDEVAASDPAKIGWLTAGYYTSPHEPIEAYFTDERIEEVMRIAGRLMSDDWPLSFYRSETPFVGLRGQAFCAEAAEIMERETRYFRRIMTTPQANAWERFATAFGIAAESGFVRYR